MESIIMFGIVIIAVAILIMMLIKKMDIKITLLIIGMTLMYIALSQGKMIALRGFKSSGNIFLDPIFALVEQFKITLPGAGLIILTLGGYAAYMNKIGANEITVDALTRPLKKIKSAHILVPIVFLLGNFLSLVIPSASNLAIILLATLYPVLRSSGMSVLTSAGVIATTATIIPTPLGGDNVAIAEEFSKLPEFLNLNVAEYVFKYHAIVSIPTLIFIAVVHYFWQKSQDKKNLNNDEIIMSQETKKIQGGLLFRIIYSLLPLFPIIILLVVYILQALFGIKVKVTVEVATLCGFILAIICELITKKDNKKVLQETEEFFKGMGNSFGIVILLVAASIFVAGLNSLGVIKALQESMTNLNGAGLGFVLPLILVGLTTLIVLLSGSGTALFYAMIPLMAPLAYAAGISPIAVSIPMGLAGNLLRAVSPVSAVIVIVAASTNQNPFEIVKRTSVPMILGTVCMFGLSMIFFL